jgi:hypothetical protein
LDDRRKEEYRADMMESNLRYDNAFDTVLSHTPAIEITEFWHLFGEEHDDGGMVGVDADIDLGEGTRLSEAAPAMPFDVSNPMHNPMHIMHQKNGDIGADSMVESPATGNTGDVGIFPLETTAANDVQHNNSMHSHAQPELDFPSEMAVDTTDVKYDNPMFARENTHSAHDCRL